MWNQIKAIDIALHIFVLTSLGYLVTFLFEWGYNSYFFLPIEFIELTVANITRSIALLGIFLMVGFIYQGFASKETDLNYLFNKIVKPTTNNSQYINIFIQLLSFVIIIIMLYLWRDEGSAFRIIYIDVALIFFYIYCKTKEYKQFCLIIFVIFILIQPYILGAGYAKNKNNFLIFDDEYIVIRFYEDKIILGQYDMKKSIIKPVYKITSLDAIVDKEKELKGLKINDLKVLKPKENLNPQKK